MRSNLSVVYDTAEVSVDLPVDAAPWPADQARRWLDEQFVAYDCEPPRASGKVLTADKLLAIAEAIGHHGFEQDATLRLAFAHAALAALSRRMVRIDVVARTVSY